MSLGGAASGERNECNALIPLLPSPGPLSLVAEGQGADELVGDMYGKPQELAISLGDTVSMLHSQSIKIKLERCKHHLSKGQGSMLAWVESECDECGVYRPMRAFLHFVCALTEAKGDS